MLIRLELTNFRQHQNRVFDFTPGLQVLRGSNEAGKSTVIWGVLYALGGSRSLPLPFSELVTWGCSENSLKVKLVFKLEEVEYTIERKKSGAVLSSSTGVTADGQSEVTAFVERLFKVPMSTVTAVSVASQKSLEDTLDGSSLPLIERLANMRLIDELMQKVHNELPSGNTKMLHSQLEHYRGVTKPAADTAHEQAQVQKAEAAWEAARAESSRLFGLEAVAAAALQEKKAADTAYAKWLKWCSTLVSQIEDLEARESWLVAEQREPVESPEAQVELYNDYKRAKDLHETYALYAKAVKSLPKMTPHAGSYENVVSEINRCKGEVQKLLKQCAELDVLIAKLEALLITETHCGLCQKDLRDIPEVQQKNAKLYDQMRNHKLDQESLREDLKTAQHNLKIWEELAAADVTVHRLMASFADVALDETVCPAAVTWAGPIAPSAEVVDTAYKRWQAAEQRAGQYEEYQRLQAELATVQQELEQKQGTLAEVRQQEPSQVSAYVLELAESHEEVFEQYRDAVDAEAAEHDKLVQAKTNLQLQAQHIKAALQAYEAAQAQVQHLETHIAEVEDNNSLLVKLREVRPVVARELWSLVLAGVSHYFSQMRGVQSVVQRGEGDFLVDGRVAKSYSGSTQDCLGLAIRIMLQKTFLPHLGMFIVDEPGAAFDDVRESDMLGVLSSCGFEQVLLVTHSDLADTFAANVIQV